MSDKAQAFDDEYWMRQALALTQKAEAEGEVPVAALLVKDNQVIGRGWNQSIGHHDPSAHAEIMALRDAGSQVHNYRHPDTTLYVTLEPCPMCVGAIIHARVKRLVFGAFDFKTGAAGSCFDLLQDQRHYHRIEVMAGVLDANCAEALRSFFRRRRAEHKAKIK